MMTQSGTAKKTSTVAHSTEVPIWRTHGETDQKETVGGLLAQNQPPLLLPPIPPRSPPPLPHGRSYRGGACGQDGWLDTVRHRYDGGRHSGIEVVGDVAMLQDKYMSVSSYAI